MATLTSCACKFSDSRPKFNKLHHDNEFNDKYEVQLPFWFSFFFLAFVYNLLQLQIDKTKLISLYKRPNP